VHVARGLPAGPTRFTTRFTGFGFIDREGTAFELLALEPGNGSLRRVAVGHFHESKAFGAASIAISNDTDLVHNSIRLKELTKVMVGSGERQIANINIHGKFLVENGTNDRQIIRAVCRNNTERKRRDITRRSEEISCDPECLIETLTEKRVVRYVFIFLRQ